MPRAGVSRNANCVAAGSVVVRHGLKPDLGDRFTSLRAPTPRSARPPTVVSRNAGAVEQLGWRVARAYICAERRAKRFRLRPERPSPLFGGGALRATFPRGLHSMQAAAAYSYQPTPRSVLCKRISTFGLSRKTGSHSASNHFMRLSSRRSAVLFSTKALTDM